MTTEEIVAKARFGRFQVAQDILAFAALPMLCGACGMFLLEFERSSNKLAPAFG